MVYRLVQSQYEVERRVRDLDVHTLISPLVNSSRVLWLELLGGLLVRLSIRRHLVGARFHCLGCHVRPSEAAPEMVEVWSRATTYSSTGGTARTRYEDTCKCSGCCDMLWYQVLLFVS